MHQTLNTSCAVKDRCPCVVESKWAGRQRQGLIVVETELSIQLQSLSKRAFEPFCSKVWCVTVVCTQGTGGSFGIDNEEYEAMPVEVKLLPRKLRFFCDPRMREQLLEAAAPPKGVAEEPLLATGTRAS